MAFQRNPNVIYTQVLALKEKHVARLHFMGSGNWLAMAYLLVGVSWQSVTADLKHHLNKAGAVYTEGMLTPPKVWGIEILKGDSPKEFILSFLTKVLRLTIECELFLHLKQFRTRDGYHTSHQNH
jgi:hypothetical protein